MIFSIDYLLHTMYFILLSTYYLLLTVFYIPNERPALAVFVFAAL